MNLTSRYILEYTQILSNPSENINISSGEPDCEINIYVEDLSKKVKSLQEKKILLQSQLKENSKGGKEYDLIITFYELGLTFYLKGEYEKAIQEYETLLKINASKLLIKEIQAEIDKAKLALSNTRLIYAS